MNKLIRTVALSFALTGPALAGGVLKPEGWWIVLGSFANPDLSETHDKEIRKLRSAAASCGIDPFNDFSNKFKGFSRGLDVVVVGAYRSRENAESVLRRVRPCVPGAYMKYGRHLGE